MSEEEPRIGVYVCHCGTNIAGVVDVRSVAEHAAALPNVAVAKDYIYMCSSPAQAMIKEDIKKERLNRIIVASCSPKLHETTFQGVVKGGGLNPYLFEMANIREQCAWVHFTDPEKATTKADDLIRIAIAKARLLEPLEKKEVEVVRRALVLGGGMTGMKSSLDLAQRGFEMHLIEKSPTLGGQAARLNRLTRTEKRASDVVKSFAEAIASEENITVHTMAELQTLEGFIGNFSAKIVKKPRHVGEGCDACGKCEEVCQVQVPNEYDHGLSTRKAIFLPFKFAYPNRYALDIANCTKCGKCVDACEKKAITLEGKEEELQIQVGTIIVATGFSPYQPDRGEYGYGEYENVKTLLQLERLLDDEGPTKGEVRVNGAPPKNVVFISCVGSRQLKPKGGEEVKVNTYCSRVCCAATLKNALLLKEKCPEANIFYLYRDVRTYGREEELYRKASEFVKFVKYKADEPPRVSGENGQLTVNTYDLLLRHSLVIPADLVVLAVGMVPREDASEVQEALRITRSADGFFKEAHLKLRPLETSAEGIFLAGAAQAPKNIIESVASGSAAAAKAAIPLARGIVELDPIKALVIDKNCDGCAFCIDPCPTKAITLIEYTRDGETKKTVEVNETLCKGCGVCQATCPKRGIIVRGFTLDQLTAMMEAALAG